ncbi:MAG TPA: protein phosphatase 2C domain-containing protein [Bryobacteraceae bacterium]|nr:protein phosphatase 2C domain-containing protein [Bryobacteraceae bacterium]
MRVLSDASTDPGHIRRRNEDAVFSDGSLGVFFVVDGMGGQAAGQEAARIALDTLKGRLERPNGTPERRIREAIALANNAVFEAAQRTPGWQGMGCVLTVAVVEDGKLHYGHVGDTRLYKISAGAIRKVTKDHSPVGEREDSGEIGEREAMKHPRRNEVFRDVGSQLRDPDDPLFIETGVEDFEPDAAFLLCSDGLSDVLTKDELRSIVEEAAGDPKRVTGRLIEAAAETSKDNISAVYLEGERFARPGTIGEETQKWRRPKKTWPVVAGVGLAGALFISGLWMGQQLVSKDAPRQLHVAPNSIATITQAVEQARAGDRILVAPGDYREQVRLKSDVEIIASPMHMAVLVNQPAPAVIAEGVSQARLSGFVIRAEPGEGYERGIVIKDSQVALDNIHLSGARLSGIEFTGNSSGRVSASFLHHNSGVSIAVEGEASPQIEHCTFSNNGKLPAIRWSSSAKPALSFNAFSTTVAESLSLPLPDPSIEAINTFAPKPPPPPPARKRP